MIGRSHDPTYMDKWVFGMDLTANGSAPLPIGPEMEYSPFFFPSAP